MYICIYEIRDRQDPVKGSGWVLFPPPWLNNPFNKWWSGISAFRNAQNSDCYFSLCTLSMSDLIASSGTPTLVRFPLNVFGTVPIAPIITGII